MASTLKQIARHPLGFSSLLVIVLAVLAAITAYWWIPDASPLANRMDLTLANKPPGYEIQEIRVKREKEGNSWWEQAMYGKTAPAERIPITAAKRRGDTLAYRPYHRREGSWKELGLHRLREQDGKYRFTRRYWLGTDRFGRDLLSRLVLGARVSLAVGLVAVFLSLLIGVPLGAVAAYYGGWVDKVILWFINVVWSIPGLLLVIAVTLALGKGFWQVFVAIGLTMWVEVARVVRGQVMSLVHKEFVQAAQVLGFTDLRIIFKHILPHTIAPLIVISAANFAAAILVESGLSFLGIGAQPPVPSWGGMIKDHYAYIIVDKAYLALIPGTAIMLLVLAFMLLGNTLRDVWDVRSAKQ